MSQDIRQRLRFPHLARAWSVARAAVSASTALGGVGAAILAIMGGGSALFFARHPNLQRFQKPTMVWSIFVLVVILLFVAATFGIFNQTNDVRQIRWERKLN
jgi:hypothetical protein